MTIETIEQIQQQIRNAQTCDWSQHGQVKVQRIGELFQFNYTAEAEAIRTWTFLERVSRGLLLHETGDIVARPFDKFFNWGEMDKGTDAPLMRVTEKIDGSLGILYRQHGHTRIATRNSLSSSAAVAANQLLRSYDCSRIPESLTLMFEIVVDACRHVIDTCGRNELILIGGRHRQTGAHLTGKELNELAGSCGFPLVREYAMQTVDEILEEARTIENSEGFVGEFADGSRFKFKSASYLKRLREAHSFPRKRLAQAMAKKKLAAWRAKIPSELVGAFDERVLLLRNQLAKQLAEIDEIYKAAPKRNETEFAVWVKANYAKRRRYWLARKHGKDVEALLLRNEF